MRKWLGQLAFGAVMVAAGAFAANVGGPQSPSDWVNVLNAQLLNWMTVNGNGGELQLLGPNSFVPNGLIATTMTSLGPTGSHTTVQRWMVVMSPAGVMGFVPVY